MYSFYLLLFKQGYELFSNTLPSDTVSRSLFSAFDFHHNPGTNSESKRFGASNDNGKSPDEHIVGKTDSIATLRSRPQ